MTTADAAEPPTEPPTVRRSPVARTIAVALLVAVAAASCDTGDGKTLQEPAVAFTTTVPPPETLLSVPLETSEPVTLPAEDLVADTPVAAPQTFLAFAPWQDGAPIGPRYGCDGENVAPAVSWASPPEGTAELAIAMVDESAIDGDGPFVHWVLAGIDPDGGSLLEGDVPPGAVQGLNSFGSIGYGGPCPPPGDEPHVYRLTVYALNQQSELADGSPADNLLEFIENVAIGAASLTGTAGR